MQNLERTNLGLTNQNYITMIDGKRKFVRIPYQHNLALFDYQTEALVMEAIKPLEINLPYDSLDVKTGIKISPYIENITTLSQQPDSHHALAQIAHHLRLLHGVSLDIKTFDVACKYHQYRHNNHLKCYDLTEFESLLEQLNGLFNGCLCHNDCVDGNLIFIDQKHFLIDYEYAALNHPVFDLMSVITENYIHDQQLIHHFLSCYFGQTPTTEQLQLCNFFGKLHALLWCQWAMMQAGLVDDNSVYLKIAQEKFEQLNLKKGIIVLD